MTAWSTEYENGLMHFAMNFQTLSDSYTEANSANLDRNALATEVLRRSWSGLFTINLAHLGIYSG